MTPIDRNDLIERDLQSHAKTITELTMRMSDYEKDKAVREVKDEHLEERFERIEDRVQAIYRLGLWILAAFGGSFVALVANFVFRGGLIAP
jgi:hypothetical protein